MARPANVQSITLSGSMPGGERWATSFWTSNGPPSNYTSASATGVATSTAGAAFIQAMRPWLSSQCSITGLTLRAYGASNQGAQVVSTATLAQAGSGSNTLPNSTCVVLTLRTDLGTGRGRGRMFVPATGISMDPDGTFPATNLGSLLDAAANFLGAQDAVVVSLANSAVNLVNRVDADRRPDVQRRRADKQITSRISRPVT